jgi:hypothetical protein
VGDEVVIGKRHRVRILPGRQRPHTVNDIVTAIDAPSLTDTNASTHTKRFYRIRVLP